MSDSEINVISTEDPAELFYDSETADWCLPFYGRPCLDVPKIHTRNVDPPALAHGHWQCPQTFLDAVADISQFEQGNVPTTMASLKVNKGTLETRLYIAFDHKDDEQAGRCSQHIKILFNMLRKVPYKPPVIGSPKVITGDLTNELIKFSCAIHDYSFDIFAYRVAKCKDKLSEIQGYIEQDGTYFTDDERSKLLRFLRYVAWIIKFIAREETTKRVPNDLMRLLLDTYLYWTKHDLLPEDSLAHNTVTFTLLNRVDIWLDDVHGIGSHLARYALNIMSILISAKRLFALTQSHRRHKIIQGDFSVEVLPSPTTSL